MRTLLVGVVLLVSSRAMADGLEAGFYGGGFISNYYHQFYQLDLFPGGEGAPDSREELQRLSPMGGLRLAYFVTPWFGVEGEFNTIMTQTKMSHGDAHIFGGRAQLMFQLPGHALVPYIALGDGFDHVSSEPTVLGSDTDWPVHAGAGVRLLVSRIVTLRIDGRFLRAPSQQAPYTLNASLGEFMLGVSLRQPARAPEPPPLPPPPPPKDSDGDGIFDDQDRCPNEPEDKDMFDDSDGCPDPDNDADGIPDAADKCPLDAEDQDGFQDDDGCVDEDNDNDGVPDKQDRCIAEPEDKDGFQDLDGCPELDNDNDGIPDAQDQCVNEAETINGNADDDGCPDKGDALVVLSPDRLDMLEGIEFKKTAIQKKSFNLLGQIGATLRAHAEILRLRITVHVQPTKKPDVDMQLSRDRAAAIRDWLVNYGIDAKRLEPRGFGGTKPLVPTTTKGSKAINERVDLIILEKK